MTFAYFADRRRCGYGAAFAAAALALEVTSSAARAQVALPSLEVTGERANKPLNQTPSSVKVITPQPVQQAPSQTAQALPGTSQASALNTGEVVDPGRPLNEVIATAPNFTIVRSNEPAVIRGIEGGGPGGIANTALGGTPTRVPLVVDGVTRPASLPFVDFNSTWDAKQIEVLNGPQTTYQGRAAIAGTIVVNTNDPAWKPEVAAEGVTRINKFGATKTLNGMINSPLIDNLLAARIMT